MSKVIGYHVEQLKRTVVVSTNTGESIESGNLAEIFDFLLNLQDTADFHIFWSLYDIVGVCEKLLPPDAFQILKDTDKLQWGDYKIFSSEKRMFAIGNKHFKQLQGNTYEPREINFFNIDQFFPDAAVTNAQEVYAKAAEFDNYLSSYDLHPTKWTSAVTIYIECVLSKVKFPTYRDIPASARDILVYAENVGWREWAAVYQVGQWEEAWDIDLNSAYPSIVQNLPNTSDAKLWYAKTYQPNCDYALLKGKATIDADFSPILDKDNIPFKGTKDTFITKDMWAALNVLKLGHFEMEDGWFIKCNHPEDKPYKELMTDLFEARGESGLERLFPKLVANGFCGKLMENYTNRLGDFYNPILGCHAATRTSIKLGKMIIQNNLQNNVISVSIDGSLFDIKPNIPTGTGMGELRISEPLSALVFSIEHQWLADKHPTGNYYPDIVKAIKADPKSPMINGIFLNNDLKTNRNFPTYPKVGRDLLEKKYRSIAIEAE